MSELFSFNPIDPEVRRKPYALYERGRAIRFHRHRELPVPLVSAFRYADCQAILKDDELWSNDFRSADFELPEELDEFGQQGEPSMLGLDGEPHHRLRGLVNRAFTPRIVQAREVHMRELARNFVADAIVTSRKKGEVDLVQALTYPLPVTIIAEIIGVPAADRERFKGWSDQAVALLGTGFFGGVDIERLKAQRVLIEEMRRYFLALAEERRKDPRDDLLTGLVEAEHEGSRLSVEELLAMLILILIAGNETTTTLIGNAVLTLLDHPDELARLRADPSLMPTAIEEVMRFTSPVQFDPRRATRSTVLGDEVVRENDMVLCWLAAANRDEDAFADAKRFDIGRAENRHLGFGFGVHYCLGANLARLEAGVALEALLEATARIELATEGPLPLHPSPVFRGVTSLPLRLESV